MSSFKIDSEKVNEAVEKLRKLLEQCEELYNKEIPESTVDKGNTHETLHNLCQNIRISCQDLGELINNTILFLGKSSEMFDTSDKESANAIIGDAASTSNGTNQNSAPATYPSGAVWSGNNVNIRDENGNVRWPYSQYMSPGRYTFGNEKDTMQCVGYVWARYEELTGRKPNFGSIGCAANLISQGYYQRDTSFCLNTDINSIKVPAIVVTSLSDTGHVVIVERVENGKIWYSEANAPNQSDGHMT